MAVSVTTIKTLSRDARISAGPHAGEAALDNGATARYGNFSVLRLPYSWLFLFRCRSAVPPCNSWARRAPFYVAFHGAVMPRIRTLFAVLLALIPFGLAVTPAAAQTEKRIALVIGNSTYQAGGTLNTPANDAGLVAQTLQAAGFDVVGARGTSSDARPGKLGSAFRHRPPPAEGPAVGRGRGRGNRFRRHLPAGARWGQAGDRRRLFQRHRGRQRHESASGWWRWSTCHPMAKGRKRARWRSASARRIRCCANCSTG